VALLDERVSGQWNSVRWPSVIKLSPVDFPSFHPTAGNGFEVGPRCRLCSLPAVEFRRDIRRTPPRAPTINASSDRTSFDKLRQIPSEFIQTGHHNGKAFLHRFTSDLQRVGDISEILD
jgi:hypothetical protein